MLENPVEKVLKDSGPQGLSLKELSKRLGVDRRRIQFHIYNSKNIKDTEPWLHGSGKSKIRVFSYTPEEKGYFLRKLKSKKNLYSMESSV
jgi:hypothetical protein